MQSEGCHCLQEVGLCLETSGLLLLDPFEKRKFSIQMCVHSV